MAELDAQRPVAVNAGLAEDTGENAFQAVFCQDWQIRMKNYREYARLYQEERRLAPHMRGTPIGHGAATGCIGQPDPVNNPQHRLRFDDTPKVLMLNAMHDPATGYEWAVNAHRQARRDTVLVTYDGWGHGAYDRGDCTRGAVDTYLIGLTLPRDGTHCPAVEPPVTDVTSGDGTSQLPPGPRPGVPGWLHGRS